MKNRKKIVSEGTFGFLKLNLQQRTCNIDQHFAKIITKFYNNMCLSSRSTNA